MPPPDAGFLIGADLVEFNRRDLPIYAMPVSPWADAGHDLVLHGASLDRLFGEPGEVHMAIAIGGNPELVANDELIPTSAEDPLVVLSGLNDGLMLPTATEHAAVTSLDDNSGVTLQPSQHLPDATALCDFGSEFRSLLPLTDGWYWDLDRAGWVVDHHHA